MTRFTFNSYAEEVEAIQKMSKEEYDDYVRERVQTSLTNLENGGKTRTSEEVMERLRQHIEWRKAERNK